MRRTLALCLLTALVLAGCTVAPKPKKQVDLTGTVRVLVLGGPGMESTLFTGFTASNPNVKTESVQLPEEGDFDQIAAQIKSGEIKVDAIVAPANNFLFAQGVVAPLDDMVKADRISLSEYGDSIQFGKYNGKLYGLPVSLSPMVVTYNREMFEKAGLKAPAAGWTWEDFDRAAVELAKQQTGKEKGWGVGIPPWSLVDLLFTAGKGPADPDLKPLQATFNRILRLKAGEKLLAPESVGADSTDYFLAFARGEIGMVLGYWENSFAHAHPEFPWGVAPIPGSAKTPGIATLAMVASNAENKENANAFIQWVAGPSGAAAVVRMPGAPVPAYVDETIQKDWLSHTTLKEDSAFVLKLQYLPPIDYPAEMAALLLKEADAAIGGKKAAAEAIKAYEEARAPFMSKK
ncbi:MAG TPA: extracellular solute-binding protein [Symbiobacteriaceae bacterium]|nr:extracellular solute-binding protein [Symbiobacteriaceae bacterium]